MEPFAASRITGSIAENFSPAWELRVQFRWGVGLDYFPCRHLPKQRGAVESIASSFGSAGLPASLKPGIPSRDGFPAVLLEVFRRPSPGFISVS